MAKLSEMGLDKKIVDALKEAGVEEAFPIQEAAIPHILNGEDIIGQAHTGTGKTFAFSLPLIQMTDPSVREVSVLVLVPTRELALQVVEEMMKASKYTGVKAIPVYGGTNIGRQMDFLRWKQQIIVATPGRLIDLYKRKAIDLGHVKHVVLDEADRMLDMGFINDVEFILSMLPKSRQTLLFSATMPDSVIMIADRHMRHPVKILIDTDDMSAELIDQTYLVVDERRKLDHLEGMLKNMKGKVLIFCSTKYRTSRLSKDLYRRGFRTSDIHGDLSQPQREEAMRRFKEGRSQILVATDVAARGIDIPFVEHVINFDVPMDPLMYFHRIGRTARAGKSGKALTLVSQDEYSDFQDILRHTKVFIKQLNEEMGIKVSPMEGVAPRSYGGRRFHGRRAGGRFSPRQRTAGGWKPRRRFGARR